jgi:uncharacterized protein (DUF1015 family)
LILPEVYLNDNVDNRIYNIHKKMKEYLDGGIFCEYKDCMIYVERTLSNGKVRKGLIGVVDLEEYSYEEKSKSLVRATEKTVVERIPPRMKVRENALLELPHIMLLIDDNNDEIINNLSGELLYDFDLMKNGGHIKGYKLSDEDCNLVTSKLEKLDSELLFAVGDGNHSLATAKECYKKNPNELNRYALVELVNLHSDALEFESINRVVFDCDTNDLINSLYDYYVINENGLGQRIEIITRDISKVLYIENAKSNISVGSVQAFLDDYLSNHKGRIDYIHGEDVLRSLCSNDGCVGFLVDVIDKHDLFKTVILDGSLPRKAFSMGHSYDKRFYLEARRIK